MLNPMADPIFISVVMLVDPTKCCDSSKSIAHLLN
ncbi:hypothetical protein NTE_03488 [Candidatus Nitrososphaera evergladensis SR1]|uniref:Uncharacterized protein n=1 Tax=Candidatus Nitrososphaera evergladensis SR1 TaxID=1459636 RepID=A0A075MV35_9ARCH|nr:hypothetical protein NTE_03488 [Candidatus Nitrososphaera evergladensis SR1]